MLLRRVVHRLLKRYLTQVNFRVEGRRITWLRLLSQSIYLGAIYIAVWSFNFNNEAVTFGEFLNYNLIESKKFTLSFYHIIVIFAIFFGARIFINILKLYLSKKFRAKPDYDPGSEYVYIQLAKYIIYVIAFFFSLQGLDIDITIFLTGSAALLVGLGLGLQDVFKDIFSGIVLLFEGNMKVGDVIEIRSSGNSESMTFKILKINVRTTQIETRDGNMLIMPNTKLTQEYIENWTHGTKLSRFKIFVSVAYGTNTELVTRLLKQSALGHPKVKKTQPVQVRLIDFGDNGLNMELIFWADQSWDVNNHKSEIRFEIDRLFREYKIVIPFPQRDMRIHPSAVYDTKHDPFTIEKE
jgi:small-conductance mechanosensitive channel